MLLLHRMSLCFFPGRQLVPATIAISTCLPEVIIENRNTAVKMHHHIPSKDPRERPLTLYTDRSVIEGKIGAAVSDLQDHRAHSQMGDDSTCTVYAAELRGISMALNPTLNSTEQSVTQAKNSLVLFADS